MSEMVDRVARAISELYTGPLYSYGDPPPPEVIARAAIAAMREPTDAMVAAAFYLTTEQHGHAAVYWAMTNAALEP